LNEKLTTRESLKEFVSKLKEGKHVWGVAVYLNQRYPREKTVTLSYGFPVAGVTTTPLDISVNGQKRTLNISWLTFGRILFDHCQYELDLIDESDIKE
jgi:hypothetical protein